MQEPKTHHQAKNTAGKRHGSKWTVSEREQRRDHPKKWEEKPEGGETNEHIVQHAPPADHHSDANAALDVGGTDQGNPHDAQEKGRPRQPRTHGVSASTAKHHSCPSRSSAR